MSSNLNKEGNLSNFISSITDLTTEYTKIYPQDKKDIWSILLNYLQNESTNGKGTMPASALGHDGFRQDDIKDNTVWSIVDAYSDLDKEQSEVLEWFNSNIYQDIMDLMKEYWNSTFGTTYPSEVTRSDSLWNDSLEYFLKYFYQYIDPAGLTAYEESGYLVENDDGTINTDYLRGSIPVSGGVSMRITDVKNADAGFYFVKESEIYQNVDIITQEATYDEAGNLLTEAITTTLKIVIKPWVIPWYNVNGHSYSYVRSDDKIVGVLANDEHLQFTRERYGDQYITKTGTNTSTNGYLDGDVAPNTTSQNPYIRLIMPEYKRRVEIEDLDRNFWVIAQVITAISAYLFDDDSPIKKMFKELLNEVMQLWENVLYLWAAVAGLGSEPDYTNVHTEVVYLPNSEEQSYLKYDNFVRRDNSNENYFATMSSVSSTSFEKAKIYCMERLQYLIQTYTESNLVIVPVIRINNYDHNYYKGEYYPFIMVFNRNEKYEDGSWRAREKGVKSDYVFSDNEIIKYPGQGNGFIVSIGDNVYAIHENELTYNFAYPFDQVDDTDNGVWAETNCRYYGILRTRCVFGETPTLDDIIAAQENSKWMDELSIEVGDVAKALYKDNAISYITRYKCSGGTGTNNESLSFDTSTTSITATKDISRGYYQGELISDFKNTNVINWTPKIESITLVPYYDMAISSDGTISYTSSLSDCKEESADVIEKYIEVYPPDKQNITLYIGEHMYASVFNSGDTTIYYYLDSNGNLSTAERNSTITNGINLSATLVISALNIYKTYEDFVTYSGYSDYKTTNLTTAFGSYLYLRTYDVYYKTKDGKIKSDNWVIKVTYIYALGSKEEEDYTTDAYYSTYFNTSIALGSNSGYGPYAPVIRISVHYFTPDKLYQKMLLRTGASSFSSLSNFLVNGGTFNLSGYTAYPLTSNGTQARSGVWGTFDNPSVYDFEKYPGNGLTL